MDRPTRPTKRRASVRGGPNGLPRGGANTRLQARISATNAVRKDTTAATAAQSAPGQPRTQLVDARADAATARADLR